MIQRIVRNNSVLVTTILLSLVAVIFFAGCSTVLSGTAGAALQGTWSSQESMFNQEITFKNNNFTFKNTFVDGQTVTVNAVFEVTGSAESIYQLYLSEFSGEASDWDTQKELLENGGLDQMQQELQNLTVDASVENRITVKPTNGDDNETLILYNQSNN